MTQPDYPNLYEVVMEQLIQHGPQAFRDVITAMMNQAMQIERSQFLGAVPHERSDNRRGHANGFKPKQVDTTLGTLNLSIPKTRNHGESGFYPHSLEQGRRSERALMLCVAQMYVSGVSTRRVEKVLDLFGIEKISSTQVSRATALLDDALSVWRDRGLGEIRYLVLDARYERVRMDHEVVDAAVLSAVGILPDGRRSVLGVQIATSEAEINWREFLQSLVKRGMHGITYIASDDHAGLKAARRAVFPGVPWQRCQFHLAQNAINHAPTAKVRSRIGGELRSVWNATDEASARAQLEQLAARYESDCSKLSQWLLDNVPEGLTVFNLPESHHRKMRTTNGIERPIQQEIKRRTRIVRVFPNEASLLRLVSAILVEIDDEWSNADKRYIVWNDDNDST